ncbi:MAG: hypothetical protein ACRD8O_10395 [Bryobacteraceae bacterium]
MKRLWTHAAIVVAAVAGVALISGVTARQTIAQTTLKAVLTKNVDEPGRVPYKQYSAVTCAFANVCNFQAGAVPDNKRLVVTQIYGFWPNLPNTSPLLATFGWGLNQFGLVSNPILSVAALVGSAGGYARLSSFSVPVSLTFEAGQQPTVVVTSDQPLNGNPGEARITMSGYLVDLTL